MKRRSFLAGLAALPIIGSLFPSAVAVPIENASRRVLITPDSAFFEQLAASAAWIESAQIADLQVASIQIQG